MASKKEVLPPDIAASVLVARESLATYIALVHKTDDGVAAIPPRHLMEIVIPALMDDRLGDTLIVTPPGSIKTNTLIGYLAWQLGRDPTQHVAYICASGSEAEKRSLAIRDTIELSPLYRTVFPDVEPNKARGWAADSWYLKRRNLMDKNPSLLAVGTGGRVKGARLHKAVLDDLSDEDNIKTHESRMQLWRFLSETVKTRMHPTLGRQIMLATREHEEDAAGYCIDRGWTVITIPALNEAGESYWEDYYPAKFLACPNDEHDPAGGQCCMKRELGKDGFARHYMGEVMDMGEVRFKPDNWRRYSTLPEDAQRGVITVDTAGWDEKNPRGDYAVLSAWKTTGNDFYCTEVQRGQWTFSEVSQRAKEMQITHNLPILVEDVPWARPLIDALRNGKYACWGVNGWKVGGRSKFNRAEAIVPLHEAGNCWLPTNAPWVNGFIQEHQMFPNGAHDDQVDTTAMALSYLSKYAGKMSLKKPGKPYTRNWDKVSA